MKLVLVSVITLLAACAGTQLPQQSQPAQAMNCGVLVYTSAAGARALERVCNERPVKLVR